MIKAAAPFGRAAKIRENRGLRDVRDVPVVHGRIGAALLDLFGQRDALRPRRSSRPQEELRRSEGAAPGVLAVGTCVPGWAGVASVARRAAAGGRIRPSCHPSRTSPPTERAIAIPAGLPGRAIGPCRGVSSPTVAASRLASVPARPGGTAIATVPRGRAAARAVLRSDGCVGAARAAAVADGAAVSAAAALSFGALARCRCAAERGDADPLSRFLDCSHEPRCRWSTKTFVSAADAEAMPLRPR